MAKNPRMYLINNLEKFSDLGCEKAGLECFESEYEITADANIRGEFSHGPYSLIPWTLDETKPGEKKKLVLGVKFMQLTQAEDAGEKSSYFVKGGIPEELIVLSSLFLRRRLSLGPVIRWDGRPCMMAQKNYFVDPAVVENQSNLDELDPWFALVEGLREDRHQRFMLAARLYYVALQLIEEHADLAYINLVSAIEALSYDHRYEPLPGEEPPETPVLYQRVLANMTDETLKEELLEELRNVSSASRKFISFTINHSEDSFWTVENPGPRHISREDAGKYLWRIYNQRSATLHKGDPFPADIYDAPTEGADLITSNRTVGSKRWKGRDIIPHPHFFERLVNHVLKVYLKRNQKGMEDTTEITAEASENIESLT